MVVTAALPVCWILRKPIPYITSLLSLVLTETDDDTLAHLSKEVMIMIHLYYVLYL
jgi:hypothetical protein